MHIYRLRAESLAALLGLLEDAQLGKQRPFVTHDGETPLLDDARIVFPWPETAQGEPCWRTQKQVSRHFSAIAASYSA